MTLLRLGATKWVTVRRAAVAGIILASSSAQATTIKDILEKQGLVGTFAWDCTKPASEDNTYIVTRILDADHVQRDYMTGRTARTW